MMETATNAFCTFSYQFNNKHKKFEEEKARVPHFLSMPCYFPTSPKRAKTEKEKQAEVSRLQDPSAADKRCKPTNTLTNEFKERRETKKPFLRTISDFMELEGTKETRIDTSKFIKDITNKRVLKAFRRTLMSVQNANLGFSGAKTRRSILYVCVTTNNLK